MLASSLRTTAAIAAEHRRRVGAGPHVKGERTNVRLPIRHHELWRCRVANLVVLGVANEPDDLDVERLVRACAERHPFADDPIHEVELSGERFVHHGHFRRSLGVCVGEFPSGKERDAERAKVIHAHSCGGRVGVHAGAGLEAFDRHVIAPVALRKDRNGGRGHGCDARHRAKLGVQSIEEPGGVVRCIAVQARRETERDQALTRDTQIHAQRCSPD